MNHKILVVDDEPYILQAIERLLRRSGQKVLKAVNGPTALEMLAAEDVAVIICDQRMPQMSGDQVLAEAAKIRPDAYRITLTGYADLQAIMALINEAGVNQFLLKPWDDSVLQSVVQTGVRWFELIRENRRLQEVTAEQNLKLESWNKRLEEQVQERTEALQRQNLDLVSLQEKLEKSLRDSVDVLAGLLESYSPSMAIHSRRVAQMAREIASHLGLSAEDLRDVEFAGLLHDIGKIAQLCRGDARPGSRDPRTRESQLPHPDSGRAILSHVDGFERIAVAVAHQQERYDGTGKPGSLKGSQIPIGSRIIAIANAYDKAVFQAKNPLLVTRDAGRRVLLDGEGTKFDPQIVRLLVEQADHVVAQGGGDLEVQLSPSQLKPGMMLSRPINNHQGLLLLKEKTVLTEAFIQHIKSLSDADPLLTGVFVHSEPAVGREREHVESPPPATAPAGRIDQSASKPVTEFNNRPAAPHATVLATPPRPDTASTSTDCPRGVISRTIPIPPVRKKVLVIDDSELVCRALTRELRLAGFDSACAMSGASALQLLEKFCPDVVLTDLAMPHMSGEELIERLGQSAPDLPCIIITGNATLEQVKKLAGAFNVGGILVKPWDHQRLTETIATALSGIRAAAKESV